MNTGLSLCSAAPLSWWGQAAGSQGSPSLPLGCRECALPIDPPLALCLCTCSQAALQGYWLWCWCCCCCCCCCCCYDCLNADSHRHLLCCCIWHEDLQQLLKHHLVNRCPGWRNEILSGRRLCRCLLLGYQSLGWDAHGSWHRYGHGHRDRYGQAVLAAGAAGDTADAGIWAGKATGMHLAGCMGSAGLLAGRPAAVGRRL